MIAARQAIAQLTAAGWSDRSIARHLNAQRIPTPTGQGAWHHSSVKAHRNPTAHAAYMRAYRARLRFR